MKTLDVLSLSASGTAISQSLNWLETIARQRHWPARTTFALRLGLDETLTNILTHGQKPGQPATRIELAVSEHGNDVVLQIADNGPAFDPTTIASSVLAESLEQATIGGHGLRLMRHYLKDMQYERSGDRNLLHLTASMA